jgi:SAM-dependent methyltransferase
MNSGNTLAMHELGSSEHRHPAVADYSAVTAAVFSGDIAQKSFLDAACALGSFCFEAEQRGMPEVKGIDRDKSIIDACWSIASQHASRVKFETVDWELDRIKESFDFVIFLDRLWKLRNPLSALEALAACTREILVIELTCYRACSYLDGFLLGAAYQAAKRMSMIFLGGSGKTNRRKASFFVTERAFETLLTRHRHQFARIEFIPGGRPGKVIAVAHKRTIGHLVIVAGVPASGKTTLIERLLAGELPDLAKALGFDNAHKWAITGFGDVHRLAEPSIPNLILHYNITTPMIENDLYGYESGLLDLVTAARRTSVITLWCPPDVLSQRYRDNRVRRTFFGSKRAKRKQKNARLLSLYSEPHRLRELFRDWLSFIQRHSSELVIFDSGGNDKILNVDEWQTKRT